MKPIVYTLIVIITIIFSGTISIMHDKEVKRQINLESTLTAKYSSEIKIIGEYDDSGKAVIVFTAGSRKYVGIKGYGIVEIR